MEKTEITRNKKDWIRIVNFSTVFFIKKIDINKSYNKLKNKCILQK